MTYVYYVQCIPLYYVITLYRFITYIDDGGHIRFSRRFSIQPRILFQHCQNLYTIKIYSSTPGYGTRRRTKLGKGEGIIHHPFPRPVTTTAVYEICCITYLIVLVAVPLNLDGTRKEGKELLRTLAIFVMYDFFLPINTSLLTVKNISRNHRFTQVFLFDSNLRLIFCY